MNGNVFYCINRGSVTTLGHGGNGGIFGILNGNLSNALNTGTIKNNDTHFGEHDADASGIVGTLSGKVERCINKGNVSSAMRYAGGIVQATSSGTITQELGEEQEEY